MADKHADIQTGIQAETQTGSAVNGLVCGPNEPPGHGAPEFSRGVWGEVAVCGT